MIVVSLYGRVSLQRAFLQSPCKRPRRYSIAMLVSWQRDDYERTGA